MEYATAALIVSVLTLLINVGMNLFGGGKGFSEKFAAAERDTATEIAKLRTEISEKQDRSENNVGDALRAMREHTHSIEKSALEFRAIAAETYMRRDSYYKASDDLKREVNAGFDKVEKRLERMEGKIEGSHA